MSIDVNPRNQRGCKGASERKRPELRKWLLFLGLSFTFAFCIFRFAFAVSWPQSGFIHWQTAYNPIETLLEPLPDLFWWSGDVNVSAPALTRGRAWSPIAVDFGVQGAPDPVTAVGRQNQLLFYNPALQAGASSGAHVVDASVTFGDSTKAPPESGILTTNPVYAGGPEVPTILGTASTSPRLIFVTHGLGLTTPGITADDPAYVQAVQVTTTGTTGAFTATALGKLKIQQPRVTGTPLETRITGMTYADIGTSSNPLPMLFLTTADGEVICVDTRPFVNSTANTPVDPTTAIRWRWVNPGPLVVVPAGGGTPRFPPNSVPFSPVPFNDGMNPAVGQVALNGLPDLPSLRDSDRQTNLKWQDQVRQRNQEWLVFVADRNGNGYAIEAFGETKNAAAGAGQQIPTPTGRAVTRWVVPIPNGNRFPPRFAVPPVFWNGNAETLDATGTLTGSNNGWQDLVVFAGVGSVTAFDAQGNFLTADKPVFWDTSQFPPGAAPSLSAGTTLPPVTRKLGEADGTTQKRWQFPEVGANPPADGRFPITVIRAMAGWAGPQQFSSAGANLANTGADDDQIFMRWNEKYVRGIDRTTAVPTEPQGPSTTQPVGDTYVERIGSISAYGSVETLQPIDTNSAVTVTFQKPDASGANVTYTVPDQYLSILASWTDTSRSDPTQRSVRGRITIIRPVGLDPKDLPAALNPGDLITVQYTPSSGGTRQKEQNVVYPSRRGHDVEPTVAGQTAPKSGDMVPVSVGRHAVTIQNEATAAANTDEFIAWPSIDNNYDPLPSDVTRYALNPGMSVANDNIYFGSRYRGRLYVIEAASLLLRGDLFNTNLEAPAGNQPAPGANDDIPAAIDPIGNPAIADGWMYASYGSGFMAAYANFGGGTAGTGIEPPVGPFGRQGSNRSAIPIPEIRVTDNAGNPITDENRLRFDWGQPVTLTITFPDPGVDSLNLTTNPVRVTIRGPMGDLPPVTISPARLTQNGNVAGVAKIEIMIPNASPANPMTPGTPLLSETPVAKRPGTAHWEFRAEQIGTNWIRQVLDVNGKPVLNPDGTPQTVIGPWEVNRDATQWDPATNTAPWFTLNNPIALVYQPAGATGANVGMIARFATAPTNRLFEGKNGDPYDPKAPLTLAGQPDVKTPTVITVGTDPANGHQLLFAEHGKSSPAMVIGIVDRTDLGFRPNLGPLKIRVSSANSVLPPKITKLGFPLLDLGLQATGVPYGSVDQNYPDDGPDGYYPSIPGDRLNVVKQADASSATTGSVALRGVVSDPNNPTAPPTTGSDGFAQKVLQPEFFNVSLDVPAYQPDGIYATRARLTDPQSAASGGTPVPTPATAIDPRTPYRDFAPDDPNVDINNPPLTVGINDRTARVTVFVDANNNGKLDLTGNYREAYRTFAVQVAVRPDMRLQTAAVSPRGDYSSRLLDLGKMWHGFETPTWRALSAQGANSPARTFFEQYWKPFVIQNTGNVNLVKIKPEVLLSAVGKPFGPVRLPGDGVDLSESMTLMRDPTRGGNPAKMDDIYLRTSFDDHLGLEQKNYGAGGVWLQKARPGSSTPGTSLFSSDPNGAATPTLYDPKLTLNIPMGTPLGTYAGSVRIFNDRQIVDVKDPNAPLGFRYDMVAPYGKVNGVLDRQPDPNNPSQLVALEPYADPTITVKVKVTEDVAAGSTGDPNVRSAAGLSSGGGFSRTSPAAGQDLSSKKLFLFYSSNQLGLTANPAQPLRYDIFGTAVPFGIDPLSSDFTFPFDPTPLSGNAWANLGQVSNQPVPNGVVVKNTKPSFAQDPRAGVAAASRQSYVFWQEEQAQGPGQTQARILYRQVTPAVGEAQVLAPGGVTAESGPVRQAPRAVVVPDPANNGGLRWFVFWNGSEQQKGNAFFSQTPDPSKPGSWTAEAVVPTSPSLGTVSDASPAYVASTGTLWLFYSGFSQRLGRSDVYATKLDPTTLGTRATVAAAGSSAAQKATYGLLGFAPRLGEILRSNPTRTMFTAGGVDWRVNSDNPLSVFINGYVPLPADGSSRPGTPVNGLQLYLNGNLVSPLTYQGLAANGAQNWTFTAPLKGGGTATVYVTVDAAAGTVQLSQPPAKLAGTPQDPQVVADYIPGSLRLTTSEAGATGTVGFVTSTYEPSWYLNTLYNRTPNAKPLAAPIAAQADRLWAVWRRAGSATTLGPTLYYRSFRPGLQIVHPLRTSGASSDFYTFDVAAVSGGTAPVLQDVDVQTGVLYFRQEDEGKKVVVTVRSATGGTITETNYIGWREESGETPVPMDVAVNEGTATAFPSLDLQPFVLPSQAGGAAQPLPHLSKIWLFWTSSRGTGSDIFHATIAPRLTPLPS